MLVLPDILKYNLLKVIDIGNFVFIRCREQEREIMYGDVFKQHSAV